MPWTNDIKTLGESYETDTKEFVDELCSENKKDKLPYQSYIDEAIKQFKDGKGLAGDQFSYDITKALLDETAKKLGVEPGEIKDTFDNLAKIGNDYKNKTITLEMAEMKMVAEGAGVDTSLYPDASIDNFKALSKLSVAGVDTNQFKNFGKNQLDTLSDITLHNYSENTAKREMVEATLKDMASEEDIDIELDNGDVLGVSRVGYWKTYEYSLNGETINAIELDNYVSENLDQFEVQSNSESIDEVLDNKQRDYLSETTGDILDGVLRSWLTPEK